VLTAVDHLVVHVSDVADAVETYRRLGFETAQGDEAAYAVFGDFYVELRGPGELPSRFWPDTSWSGLGEGIYGLVLRTDDLDDEVARLRSTGVGVSEPVDDPIDGVGGSLSRRSAAVDAPIPLGLVELHHHTDERLSFFGGPVIHPNTATVLERVYIAVEAIHPELEVFERVLGLPAPEPEMGTVIMSLMSVFHIGSIGIAVAEPRGPGPTADAFGARGAGLFQMLFRAHHLDRAAELMVGNGLPAPARGTRLSGESALLVEPAQACGAYVALAGQP
jgi:catechol 2,3-dioxygenase-like lactoylglutathione lyase family enzyme